MFLLEILSPQHEHKLIPAAGFQPGEGQVWEGGFEHVAVVADFGNEHSAGIEMRGCIGEDFPDVIQPIRAAGECYFRLAPVFRWQLRH